MQEAVPVESVTNSPAELTSYGVPSTFTVLVSCRFERSEIRSERIRAWSSWAIP